MQIHIEWACFPAAEQVEPLLSPPAQVNRIQLLVADEHHKLVSQVREEPVLSEHFQHVGGKLFEPPPPRGHQAICGFPLLVVAAAAADEFAKSARTDNRVLKERVFNARRHRDNLLVDVFGSDGIADVALAQGSIFCVVARSDSALLVLLKSRDNFWDD